MNITISISFYDVPYESANDAQESGLGLSETITELLHQTGLPIPDASKVEVQS